MLTEEGIKKRVNGRHIVYVYDKFLIREFTGLKCSDTHARVFCGTEKRTFSIDQIHTNRKDCYDEAEESLIDDLRWDLKNCNRAKIERSIFRLTDFWIRNKLMRGRKHA